MIQAFERMKELPGVVGYYWKDLQTGRTQEYHSDSDVVAASVIKIPIMAAFFDAAESGRIDPSALVTLEEKHRYPSCGAINYLHSGLQLTLEDVCVLMIILSDNSATNFLIDYLGMDAIQEWIDRNGYGTIRLNRRLFDAKAAAAGIENYISAGAIGRMLEQIWSKTLVSPKASERMLQILSDQRLNGKLPFFLHSLKNGPKLAHKTGEDDGITHDCAIVYRDGKGYVLCVTGDKTDVPKLERCMQDAALETWMAFEKGAEQ